MNTSRRGLLAAGLAGPAAWRAHATPRPRPAPADAATGAVHRVVPGQSLAAALQRAADGDQIHLLAGEHVAQAGVIGQKRLTLRGVGGRTVLHAAGAHAEGKAILVVRDGEVLIEDLELRGCRVPDGNGAGIRFERGRLTVRRCGFFDNQMGLLTGNVDSTELDVEGCRFGQAPVAPALAHLLYAGHIARLSVTGCHFSGGRRGHLLKSRARRNRVRGNHLVDGAQGSASYELEFPNGGVAEVVGNVIGQSAGSGNLTLLAMGAEGAHDADAADEARAGPRHALLLAHNTFINFGSRGAIFVRVQETRLRSAVQRAFFNNLCLGPGHADRLLRDAARGNFAGPRSWLVDAQAGRYALAPSSGLRGRGVDPGVVLGVDLRLLPAGRRVSPGAEQES